MNTTWNLTETPKYKETRLWTWARAELAGPGSEGVPEIEARVLGLGAMREGGSGKSATASRVYRGDPSSRAGLG